MRTVRPRALISPLLAALVISVLLLSLMVMFPIAHVSAGSSNQFVATGSQNPQDVACNLFSGLPESTGSITITGVSLNGTAVTSILVDLRINGNNVSQGSLPVTFTGCQLGVQYGVVVYWYGNYYIRYINDANTGIDLQRYDLVTLSQSHPNDTLTAMFEYVPPPQAASLNIIAEFPNGTQLGTASVVNGYDLHTPGMWLTVTPPFQSTPYTGTFTGGSILPFTLFNNETYTVQMSLDYYGPWVTNLTGTGPMVNITWSHWQDNNNTDPNRAITLSGNANYTAIYVQSAISQTTTTSTTTSAPSSSSSAQTTTTSQPSSSGSTQTSTLTTSGPPPAPPPGGSGGQSINTSNILTNLFGNNAILALAAAIVIVIAVATAVGIRHARK